MSKTTSMPNVRKMFIPDPGYTMFDVNLAGADAQVVAYEAEDEELIKAFLEGLDVHSKNAEDLWGTTFTSLAGDKYNGPKGKRRHECKIAVHATNYGGAARNLSRILGWTVRETEAFQRRWFGIHPGIKSNFHGRVMCDLERSRMVTNRFGYRRVYFDRIESCFTEALAWVPQSTVAETSFRGGIQLTERCSWVEMLLQVHDSLVFQVCHEHENRLAEIRTALAVPIPYAVPLTIQWGISRSRVSWGDCEGVK